MKKYVLIYGLLFFLMTSFTSDKSVWQKAYEHQNTKIYTRTTESGIKEFKAITTVNASMKSVLAVMHDYKAHPDWMRAIDKCQLVKQETSKTRYLYYTIDMPWPLWDRDLVSKSTFYPQKDKSVLMKMEAAPTKKSKSKNHVRMISAKGYWLVSSISKSKTKVVYQYKADPNGISKTLVNMFLLEAPKATFVGLKKQVKLAKYKNADLTWLYD
ncbi:MAG: START domain-containing protein [Saprospiraceae bacterium]